MNRRDFETLLLTLESTPALLVRAAATLSQTQTRCRPAEGAFSFVESVWHLADLEREAYGSRIRRILAEDHPHLPNFDGERLAREREYQQRDLQPGLEQFARARAQNLELLKRVPQADWKRCGAQEGVGRVALSDIPRMMAEHDRAHGAEIADILAMLRGDSRPDCGRTTSAVA
ncbi:MAG: DinB family protein [Acidobacteriota bacterium]